MFSRIFQYTFLVFLVAPQLVTASESQAREAIFDSETNRYHVYPGDDIQATLEAAAKNKKHKTILVHAGTYRATSSRQALIWFNRRHDGIVLQAAGEVVLTAANPDIANKSDASFPAVVNHVVYFGDGVSRATVLDGFKITGAKGFMTYGGPNIESSKELQRSIFFTGMAGLLRFLEDPIRPFGISRSTTITQTLVLAEFPSSMGRIRRAGRLYLSRIASCATTALK